MPMPGESHSSWYHAARTVVNQFKSTTKRASLYAITKQQGEYNPTIYQLARRLQERRNIAVLNLFVWSNYAAALRVSTYYSAHNRSGPWLVSVFCMGYSTYSILLQLLHWIKSPALAFCH
jgi:hypothetical protein